MDGRTYEYQGKTLERIFLTDEDVDIFEALGTKVCRVCFFGDKIGCSPYPCLKSEDQDERRSLYREVPDGNHDR